MNDKTRSIVWVGIWFGLFCVCLAFGLFTRLSYTDITVEPDRLLAMPYQYIVPQPADSGVPSEIEQAAGLNANAADLIAQSPVIVEAVFNGERKYLYQSFLSTVRVTRVIKGDEILEGQTLLVYEPIRVPSETDLYQSVMPSGMYNCGYTMMKNGDTYLLFLAPKEYPAAMDRTGKPTEYVFQENPYAKLNLSSTEGAKEYIVPDASVLLVAESMNYEILVGSVSDAEIFYKTKGEILTELNVAWS